MRQRLALRMDTMMCAACRAYERQIILIDTAFRLRAMQGKPDLLVADARACSRSRLQQGQ